MNRCETCVYWQISKEDRTNSVIFPYHPVTYEQDDNEDSNTATWGHKVRVCKCPKVLFYQRPSIDGAAVCDGSQYHAELLTGPQFGCTLHVAK